MVITWPLAPPGFLPNFPTSLLPLLVERAPPFLVNSRIKFLFAWFDLRIIQNLPLCPGDFGTLIGYTYITLIKQYPVMWLKINNNKNRSKGWFSMENCAVIRRRRCDGRQANPKVLTTGSNYLMFYQAESPWTGLAQGWACRWPVTINVCALLEQTGTNKVLVWSNITRGFKRSYICLMLEFLPSALLKYYVIKYYLIKWATL